MGQIRRASVNDKPLLISTVDDDVLKLDANSSCRVLRQKSRGSSRRYNSRARTAKKKYKPTIRDMTITDRSHNDFFGIPGYKAPRNNFQSEKKDKSLISTFNRAKILSVFSVDAEKSKRYPAPSTYARVIKWDKAKIKGGFLNKTKKMTYFDELSQKSKLSPGVGKYKWNKPYKLRGYSRDRSRKTTFMDEIDALSKEVPGHKYIKDINSKDGKYKFGNSFILKNSPNYSFTKTKKVAGKRKSSSNFMRQENGIKVSLKVAPGYYKAEDSYAKTQKVVKNKLKFNKNKERRYFDQVLHDKKGIPGVGQYKKIESAKDKYVSRPITSKGRCSGRR